MTAEVAILNKSAVALATDSAVTLSAGKDRQKIYDSADKLFQLSEAQPIGIMIYNGMSFMEMPLPIIIKEFRKKDLQFETLDQAAWEFLNHLNEVGKDSPKSVLKRQLIASLHSTVTMLQEKIQRDATKAFGQIKDPKDFSDPKKFLDDLVKKVLEPALKNAKKKFENASFFDKNKPEKFIPALGDLEKETIEELCKLPIFAKHKKKLVELLETLIIKKPHSTNRTGIIVAGFGAKEMFPSLLSFEIEGMVAGHLRFTQTDDISIDREGTRAAIKPFAQQEMVDRFVYGIDTKVEAAIEKFCSETMQNVSETTIESIKDALSEEQLTKIQRDVAKVGGEVAKRFREQAMATIRSESAREIEGMVEFMPKPELSKMAEALVELTSIKRRVSRGMETVGGPIDVALISREDGFVWIKRKHYFTAELNPRYVRNIQNIGAKGGAGD